MDWDSVKIALTELTTLDRDALHLLAGAGAHVLLVLLFRSWLGALWPVGVVALVALANEWSDLRAEHWLGMREQQYWESVKDVALTLAMPLLLVLLCRVVPGRFKRPETPAAESE